MDKIPLNKELIQQMKQIDRYKKVSRKDYLANKGISQRNREIRRENSSARLFNASVNAIIRHNLTAPDYAKKLVPPKRKILSLIERIRTLSNEERASFRAYKKANSMTFRISEEDWYRRVVSNVPKAMQWTIANIVWWDYVSIMPSNKISGIFNSIIDAHPPTDDPTLQQIVDCLIAVGYPVDFAIRRIMAEPGRSVLPEHSTPHKYRRATASTSVSPLRNILHELLHSMKHVS